MKLTSILKMMAFLALPLVLSAAYLDSIWIKGTNFREYVIICVWEYFIGCLGFMLCYVLTLCEVHRYGTTDPSSQSGSDWKEDDED